MPQFKNMGGLHVQNDDKGVPREYKTGDIVDTELELDKMLGAKFQRLQAPTRPTRKRLEDYGEKELRLFAEDNGIVIEPGDDKAEIIRALKAQGL